MANADMITMKIPPGDLMPMVDAGSYTVEVNGSSSKTYKIKGDAGRKKNKRDATEHNQMIINRFIFANKTIH